VGEPHALAAATSQAGASPVSAGELAAAILEQYVLDADSESANVAEIAQIGLQWMHRAIQEGAVLLNKTSPQL
jgi:hypothetical protein